MKYAIKVDDLWGHDFIRDKDWKISLFSSREECDAFMVLHEEEWPGYEILEIDGGC